MKINFKDVFLGVCIIAAFILGKSCAKKPDGLPTIKEVVTHRVDTVFQDTGSVKFKDKLVYVPKKEYYVETIDSLKLKEAYKVRTYEQTYKGSDIKVTVKDSVLGYLIGQHVSYQRFGVKQINTITDSTKIITQYKPYKYQVSLGGQASPLGLAFGGELTVNRNQFEVMYDPFNKTPYISYKYIIFKH